MGIKLLHKTAHSVVEHTPEQFQKLMGVSLIEKLHFQSEAIERDVRLRCRRAVGRGQISAQQKWLGVFYDHEMRSGYRPDIRIVWLDAHRGYGVIANQTIRNLQFVGEYVGVVRKRRWFFERSNDYRFEYAIAEGRRSPYTIDARERGNFTRFINHSDAPNLETVSVLHEGAMHIIVYARRTIQAGTQLSYDYGPEFWEEKGRHKLPLTPDG